MGALGVFYRRALQSILGMKCTLRNELAYILSTRLPLQAYIAKQVIRYVGSLRDSDRMVA